MERREHALKLYKKCYHYHHMNIDDDTRTQLRTTIFAIVFDFLGIALPKQKFMLIEVAEVLRDAANTVSNFSTDKCQQAFEALESLIILILSSSWKTEYYQLKLYGGFVQTRIIPLIPQVEVIIRKMGYMEVRGGNGLFILQNQPNEELLITLGFDCLIAAAECKLASILYKNMNSIGFIKFTQKDALLWRFVLSGTIDQNVVALRKTIGKPNFDVSTSDHAVVKEEKKTSAFDNRRVSTPMTNKLQVGYNIPDLLEYQRSNQSNFTKDLEREKMGNNYCNEKMDLEIYENNSNRSNNLNQKHQAIETGTKNRVSSGDDNDPYKFGTLDEHLLASLQQLDKTKAGQEKSKTDIPKLHSHSSEWDFVTDKLKSNSSKKFSYFSDSADTGFCDTPLIYSKGVQPVQKQPVYPPKITDSLDYPLPDLVSRGITQDSVISRSSGIQKDSVRLKISQDSPDFGVNPRFVRDAGSRRARESSYHEPQQRLVPPVLNQRSKSEPIVRKTAIGKSLSNTYKISPIQRRITLTDEPLDMEFSNSNFQHSERNSYSEPQVYQFEDHMNSAVIIDHSQLDQWCCTFCTVVNNSDDKICKECFKSRAGGPELEMPPSGESRRVCEQCTLENKAEAVSCDVCGGPLKNVHTYI